MQAELERLNRLAGSDPGFYVLALHSFVEHYIRDVRAASAEERFSRLVWEFRQLMIDEAAGAWVDGLDCLSEINRQHRFTNEVRHRFQELDPQEAIAATHLFVAFCVLVGLGALPEVHRLADSRRVWDERTSLTEQSSVLRSIEAELQRLQRENASLLDQLSDYEQKQARLGLLENQIDGFTLELQAVRERVTEKDARVDELRAERAKLRDERTALLKQLERHSDLARYIQALGRYSLYTRTRLDYERSLMRLTPEQEEAVRAVDLGGDYLVRGGAGTGKSLVLIEALKRLLSERELEFDDSAAAVLLTFTRTLAKFEDYVATMLKIERVRRLVSTVDTFILDRLQRIDPDYAFNFDAVTQAAAELNATEFFSDSELATEIESYLFAHFVSRQEYVDEVVPRTGMRRRLSRGQREQVWRIRDQVAERMHEAKRFSRNYARLVILEYLDHAEESDSARLRDVRTIFLDETQDLTSGDLFTLKSLVTGHLIMAADSDQSIYGVASPYTRAGIQIAGRTRVLHTNFRNTRQIQAAASRFAALKARPGASASAGDHYAFREGPPAELYTAEDAETLRFMLMRKLRLFLDVLDYEPDNICILAPHNAEVDRLAEALESAGIECAVITAKEFTFTQAGAVRLSTLHSSKGLDFPVVMLYLPYLNRHERFDAQTTERLVRNVIYVGITRAMENLNVFVSPGEDPVLSDLCEALGVRS